MGIKSGFGKAGNMNSQKTSKNNSGKTKAGFGKANTGPNKVPGYSGGKGSNGTVGPKPRNKK